MAKTIFFAWGFKWGAAKWATADFKPDARSATIETPPKRRRVKKMRVGAVTRCGEPGFLGRNHSIARGKSGYGDCPDLFPWMRARLDLVKEAANGGGPKKKPQPIAARALGLIMEVLKMLGLLGDRAPLTVAAAHVGLFGDDDVQYGWARTPGIEMGQ